MKELYEEFINGGMVKTNEIGTIRLLKTTNTQIDDEECLEVAAMKVKRSKKKKCINDED